MNKRLILLSLLCLLPFITTGFFTHKKHFTKHTPPCQDNVVVLWARMYLDLFRSTFGFLSPPLVARALFIFTASMYDSIVPYTTNLKPYLCKVPQRPIAEHTASNIQTALSYGVYRSIQQIFIQFPAQLVPVDNFFISLGYDPNFFGTDFTTAAGIGNLCSNVITASRANDGSNQLGNELGTPIGKGPYSDYTNYAPVNSPQQAGSINCSSINFKNHWVPLIITNPQNMTMVQEALTQQMGRVRPFAISLDLFRTVPPPPQLDTNTETEFNQDISELLTIYQSLGDVEKVIAEYWDLGPGNSLPAGHFHFVTIFSIKSYCLDLVDSVRVLFLQASASFDAGIIAWLVKRYYDFVRPITAIQCSAVENMIIHSWLGPYQGVGNITGSQWISYLDTPPFQEYVSGHSTFSTASAEVLKLFFGSDDYGETVIIQEGKSLKEPRIDMGEPGFIPNVTNVPNTGPNSIGYSPANDIPLFWATFTDAANQSGLSRRFGGIHFRHGDLQGRNLGRRVGKIVWKKFKKLSHNKHKNHGFVHKKTPHPNKKYNYW